MFNAENMYKYICTNFLSRD